MTEDEYLAAVAHASRRRMAEAFLDAGDALTETTGLESAVRRHPLSSVALAAGVGALAGASLEDRAELLRSGVSVVAASAVRRVLGALDAA